MVSIFDFESLNNSSLRQFLWMFEFQLSEESLNFKESPEDHSTNSADTMYPSSMNWLLAPLNFGEVAHLTETIGHEFNQCRVGVSNNCLRIVTSAFVVEMDGSLSIEEPSNE